VLTFPFLERAWGLPGGFLEDFSKETGEWRTWMQVFQDAIMEYLGTRSWEGLIIFVELNWGVLKRMYSCCYRWEILCSFSLCDIFICCKVYYLIHQIIRFSKRYLVKWGRIVNDLAQTIPISFRARTIHYENFHKRYRYHLTHGPPMSDIGPAKMINISQYWMNLI